MVRRNKTLRQELRTWRYLLDSLALRRSRQRYENSTEVLS
jgi:hypothetical protein